MRPTPEPGELAGFGGGGGSGDTGADGGYGGGGAGGGTFPASGGFGGGDAVGGVGAQGGGGAGMGGAVFVMDGGILNIAGNFSVSGNTVAAGTGATDGQAFGSGLFLQGGALSLNTLVFEPGSGETQTVSDDIFDEQGAIYTFGYMARRPTSRQARGTSSRPGQERWSSPGRPASAASSIYAAASRRTCSGSTAAR